MRVILLRGRRINPLLLALKRSIGLLLRESSRDRAAATRAKARVSFPKMGDTLGFLASQGREHVSSATSLDIFDGISLRGRDPKVMGHLSPNHQWGIHRYNLFLLTPAWAGRTRISPRVWRRHRLFHRQAREAKAWVEVRHKAHMPRL